MLNCKDNMRAFLFWSLLAVSCTMVSFEDNVVVGAIDIYDILDRYEDDEVCSLLAECDCDICENIRNFFENNQQ